MTGLKERQLFESFANKEYRDAFVEEHISSGLAFQIRALREKNGWTQGELGQRTGKAQETISQLESHDYGRFTLKTLKAIASAFDVALEVNLISFGELISRLSNLSPETIAPPSYESERQMFLGEISGAPSEWNVSHRLVDNVRLDLRPDASRLFVKWGSNTVIPSRVAQSDEIFNRVISTPLEDSTGEMPSVIKSEAGKGKHEFALAA